MSGFDRGSQLKYARMLLTSSRMIFLKKEVVEGIVDVLEERSLSFVYHTPMQYGVGIIVFESHAEKRIERESNLFTLHYYIMTGKGSLSVRFETIFMVGHLDKSFSLEYEKVYLMDDEGEEWSVQGKIQEIPMMMVDIYKKTSLFSEFLFVPNELDTLTKFLHEVRCDLLLDEGRIDELRNLQETFERRVSTTTMCGNGFYIGDALMEQHVEQVLFGLEMDRLLDQKDFDGAKRLYDAYDEKWGSNIEKVRVIAGNAHDADLLMNS